MAQKSKTVNGFDLVEIVDGNGAPGVQVVKRDASGVASRTGISLIQHGGNGARVFIGASDAGAIGADGVEVDSNGRPIVVTE